MTAVSKLRLALDDPTVLLFGAGASRGGLRGNRLPPPVDRDFFYVANQLTGHGTPTLAKRVLRSVWELYNRVEGVGLEEYFREIETRDPPGQAWRRARTRNPEQCLEAGRTEAMKYLIVIEQTSSGYSAYSPDLPGCVATAGTKDEVQREMKAAMAFHLDGLREEGLTIPEPHSTSSYVEIPA